MPGDRPPAGESQNLLFFFVIALKEGIDFDDVAPGPNGGEATRMTQAQKTVFSSQPSCYEELTTDPSAEGTVRPPAGGLTATGGGPPQGCGMKKKGPAR